MSNPKWDDLKTLGMRLNRLIKYSETMLKKTDKDDHDGKNRYITTIVSLTRQQLEIIKINDNYDEIMSWFSTLEKHEIAIKKNNIIEQKKRIQQEKQDIQNMKQREIEFQASNTKVTYPESKAKITYPKGKDEKEIEI